MFGRKLVVGLVDGESQLFCLPDELRFKAAHLLAPPARHRVAVHGLRLVGDDEVFVDADNFSVALAAAAGAKRVVEAEQVLRGLLKRDAVRLEAAGERRTRRHPAAGRGNGKVGHQNVAVSLKECGLHRIADVVQRLLVAGGGKAVDEDEHLAAHLHRLPLLALFGQRRQVLLNAGNAPLPAGVGNAYPAKAFVEEQRKLFDEPHAVGQVQRGEQRHALFAGLGGDVAGYVCHAVRLYLHPRNGRKGMPYAGVQQLEVVVYFGGGAHRGARIARADLLVYRDGRRNARDAVHLRLVHPAQKLPGVRRQALHVPALTLRKKRVERQRALARPRKPGDDN